MTQWGDSRDTAVHPFLLRNRKFAALHLADYPPENLKGYGMNRIGFVMHGLCSLVMAAGLAIAMALPAAAEVDYLDIGPDIGLPSEVQLAVLVIDVEAPAE